VFTPAPPPERLHLQREPLEAAPFWSAIVKADVRHLWKRRRAAKVNVGCCVFLKPAAYANKVYSTVRHPSPAVAEMRARVKLRTATAPHVAPSAPHTPRRMTGSRHIHWPMPGTTYTPCDSLQARGTLPSALYPRGCTSDCYTARWATAWLQAVEATVADAARPVGGTFTSMHRSWKVPVALALTSICEAESTHSQASGSKAPVLPLVFAIIFAIVVKFVHIKPPRHSARIRPLQ
jgi:hypothetical protein